jgi:predicted MPP superfamily phosphohydrolase
MPVGRIEGIVARMNALKPDITVLLGDYVNALRPRYYSKLVPVVDWAAALGHLRAPLGVYAVLGNHDWWAGEAGSIRRAFEKNAIHLLENEAVMASGGGAVFWIAGLGDQLVYHDHGVDDLAKTLGKISGGAPVILAAHEPSIFNRLPSRVTLTLAGHTHGGQVYVPFAGRPALSEEMARYAHGHIVEHGRHMIVSSGLGLSGWPVRFLVPPEIVVVTLKNSVV